MEPSGSNREKAVALAGGRGYHGAVNGPFEPFKARLRQICDRLDPEEAVSFRPLVENFSGATSEFQRIMRDLGKFGRKVGDGSTFEVYREIQVLFDQGNRRK